MEQGVSACRVVKLPGTRKIAEPAELIKLAQGHNIAGVIGEIYRPDALLSVPECGPCPRFQGMQPYCDASRDFGKLQTQPGIAHGFTRRSSPVGDQALNTANPRCKRRELRVLAAHYGRSRVRHGS